MSSHPPRAQVAMCNGLSGKVAKKAESSKEERKDAEVRRLLSDAVADFPSAWSVAADSLLYSNLPPEIVRIRLRGRDLTFLPSTGSGNSTRGSSRPASLVLSEVLVARLQTFVSFLRETIDWYHLKPDCVLQLNLADEPADCKEPVWEFSSHRGSGHYRVPDPHFLLQFSTTRTMDPWSWEEKRPQACFFGSDTGQLDGDGLNQRTRLASHLQQRAFLAGGITQFVKVNPSASEAAGLSPEPIGRPPQRFADQLRYRYILDAYGETVGWDRVYWVLGTNSILLRLRPTVPRADTWHSRWLEENGIVPVLSEAQLLAGEFLDWDAAGILRRQKEAGDFLNDRSLHRRYLKEVLLHYDRHYRASGTAGSVATRCEGKSAFAAGEEEGEDRSESGDSEAFYAALQERFRGSQAEIRRRLGVYLPYAEPILSSEAGLPAVDLGCGRGEWLELLSERGYRCWGVDSNSRQVDSVRRRGMSVERGEAISHLRSLPADSVAVLSAFHLVEHQTPEEWRLLLKEGYRVLVPGGLLLLETPNCEHFTCFQASFYLDPTHVRPVPLELLSFACEFVGFERVKKLRLQKIEAPGVGSRRGNPLTEVHCGVGRDGGVVAQKGGNAERILRLEGIWAQSEGPGLDALLAEPGQSRRFLGRASRRWRDSFQLVSAKVRQSLRGPASRLHGQLQRIRTEGWSARVKALEGKVVLIVRNRFPDESATRKTLRWLSARLPGGRRRQEAVRRSVGVEPPRSTPEAGETLEMLRKAEARLPRKDFS